MKFTTLIALVATASAIKIEAELKDVCVYEKNGDNCVPAGENPEDCTVPTTGVPTNDTCTGPALVQKTEEVKINKAALAKGDDDCVYRRNEADTGCEVDTKKSSDGCNTAAVLPSNKTCDGQE